MACSRKGKYNTRDPAAWATSLHATYQIGFAVDARHQVARVSSRWIRKRILVPVVLIALVRRHQAFELFDIDTGAVDAVART
jgi:hypothetical protein